MSMSKFRSWDSAVHLPIYSCPFSVPFIVLSQPTELIERGANCLSSSMRCVFPLPLPFRGHGEARFLKNLRAKTFIARSLYRNGFMAKFLFFYSVWSYRSLSLVVCSGVISVLDRKAIWLTIFHITEKLTVWRFQRRNKHRWICYS